MKKILSVILAAAMAASMAVSVSAAPMECGNTWTIVDKNAGQWVGKDIKSTRADAVHSGSYGAWLYADGSGASVTFTAPFAKAASDGVYNFTFYTGSVSQNSDWNAARVTTNGKSVNTINVLNATWSKETEGNFTKYTGTITDPTSTEIKIEAINGGWIGIDDIVVTGSDGSVLFEENFEYGYKPKYTAADKWIVSKADGMYAVFGAGQGYNGTKGLYLNSVGKGTETLKALIPTRTADGIYKISYDINMLCGNPASKISISLDDNKTPVSNADGGSSFVNNYLVNSDMWNITELEPDSEKAANKRWYHVEGTVTSTNTAENYFDIKAVGWTAMNLDNIVVKNSKDQVIFSEDFENTTAGTTYTYPYFISGVSANGFADKIVLSWKNPSVAVTSFKINENGEEIPDSVDFAELLKLDANKFNKIEIATDIHEGETHTYDIVYVVDGEELHKTVTATAGSFSGERGYASNGYYLKNSSFGKSASGSEAFGSVSVDSDEKYSGKTSLRINPNISGSSWNNPNTVELMMQPEANTVEAGKTYILKFMLKTLNGDGVTLMYNDANGNYYPDTTGYYVEDCGGKNYTTGWMPVEFVFTAQHVNPYIRLYFRGYADAHWIDDVALYEYNTDTFQTVGGNLISNGGFEYDVENLAISGNMITWTNPDGAGWDYIKVYKKLADGSLKFLGESFDTSFKLENATEAEETYVVKTVLGNGDITAEHETGTVKRTADLIVTEPVFDKVTVNGDEIIVDKANITALETGMIKASVNVENTGIEAGYSAKAYMALYNGNKLEKLTLADTTVVQGGRDTLSGVLNVENIEGRTLKMFVWTNEMTPVVINSISE